MGEKTGRSYVPEKDYLDKHAWEASKVHGLPLMRATNRAALAGAPRVSQLEE